MSLERQLSPVRGNVRPIRLLTLGSLDVESNEVSKQRDSLQYELHVPADDLEDQLLEA